MLVFLDINCGSPPDLSNAILAASTGIYPGDSATYLCADGFLNEGGNKLTCTDTGLWLPYTLDVNCQRKYIVNAIGICCTVEFIHIQVRQEELVETS